MSRCYLRALPDGAGLRGAAENDHGGLPRLRSELVAISPMPMRCARCEKGTATKCEFVSVSTNEVSNHDPGLESQPIRTRPGPHPSDLPRQNKQNTSTSALPSFRERVTVWG